jgi:alkylhydroperoxidase/carboxymuconolactone decarboxylase family protein YurZ
MVTIEELQALAASATSADGAPLNEIDSQLIRLGVSASVTSLDGGAIGAEIDASLAAGASVGQIQEIVSLVSALGVHSLMVTSALLVRKAAAVDPVREDALTREQQALWTKYVGADPFWESFERELPGFLRAMLVLSADQFVAFFSYCAVPWKSGLVRARVKELVALACDATPAHRFLPGFRIHLANAVTLGAGRLALAEALGIAAAAPPHTGTR